MAINESTYLRIRDRQTLARSSSIIRDLPLILSHVLLHLPPCYLLRGGTRESHRFNHFWKSIFRRTIESPALRLRTHINGYLRCIREFFQMKVSTIARVINFIHGMCLKGMIRFRVENLPIFRNFFQGQYGTFCIEIFYEYVLVCKIHV